MTAKKITAAFFATPNGGETVRDWLLELPREDRKRIGDDIKVVEFGWPIGMPVCRPLGKGLYEVRTNLDSRIARVLFAIEGDRMVLLYGFIKKTQTTPPDAIDLARTRLQMFRRS
ncbi:MAG: type II toxin-antitoxin system RelE/ParE family toxin [Rhizomicrobium sp.]